MKTVRLFFIIPFCFSLGMAESSVDLAGKTLYTKSISQSGVGRRSVIRFSKTGSYTKSVGINIYPQGFTSSYSFPDSGTYSYLNSVGSNARLQLRLTSTILPVEDIELDFTAADRGELVHDESSGISKENFELVSPEVYPSQGLTNVSMRVVAKQGFPAVIGFVVGGGRMREFLIRAVGPRPGGFWNQNACGRPPLRLRIA